MNFDVAHAQDGRIVLIAGQAFKALVQRYAGAANGRDAVTSSGPFQIYYCHLKNIIVMKVPTATIPARSHALGRRLAQRAPT